MSLHVHLYENRYGETRAVFATDSDYIDADLYPTRDTSVRCHSFFTSLFLSIVLRREVTVSLPVIANGESTVIHFNRNSLRHWSAYFSNASFRHSDEWDNELWVSIIKQVLEEASQKKISCEQVLI
jgi:hypothetical protein